MAPSWNELLDELKQRDGLRSDAALARSLSVSRTFISSIRHGRCGMPVELGRAVFVRLGRKLTPSDEALFVPKQVTLLTRAIPENKKARAAVHRRANGICELCRQDAPFTRPDGTPYLELHHIAPLGTGGKDTLVNLVLLCPNCHRKMHVIPTERDVKTLMRAASRADAK